MAITNGYCTLAELRGRMNIPTADTGSDTIYEATIEAASRAIDGFCARRFYQIADTVRYFTPTDPTWLEVPDLVSVSAFVTDADGDRVYELTWASTDYDLEPYNGADVGLPYTSIATMPMSRYRFPCESPKGVKITGTWGWPSIPTPIKEACILQAMRIAKRPSAPFGIDLGGADMGAAMRIPAIDPDVKMLCAPYRRIVIGSV